MRKYWNIFIKENFHLHLMIGALISIILVPILILFFYFGEMEIIGQYILNGVFGLFVGIGREMYGKEIYKAKFDLRDVVVTIIGFELGLAWLHLIMRYL